MKKESAFVLKEILSKKVEIGKRKEGRRLRKKTIEKEKKSEKFVRPTKPAKKSLEKKSKNKLIKKVNRSEKHLKQPKKSLKKEFKKKTEKKSKSLKPEKQKKKKKYLIASFLRKRREKKLKRKLKKKLRRAEKPPKLRKKRKGGLQKKIIVSITTLLLVVFVIFIVFIFWYSYHESPIKQLGLGANIENASVSQDGQSVYIRLAGGSNLENITNIKFVFKDTDGTEYVYETTEGIEEIEVPFRKSFWQWLFGKPAFVGTYDYDLSAGEIGLDDLNNIEEVSVILEYEEEGESVETPPLDTEEPISEEEPSTGGISGGGGGGGGGGSGEPSAPCVPSKSCEVDYIGQCGNGLSDGCENVLNCSGNCEGGEVCLDGVCVIAECFNDSDCDPDGWYNVSRLLDEQCKEINQSRQEDRNYSCNLTINACQYEIINETIWVNVSIENKINGTACDDGLFCSVNDVCSTGSCMGEVRVCLDDGINCTIPYCDEFSDLCIFNVSSCDCSSDSDCPDDENVCTDEVCVNNSCEEGYNTNPCDDGLFCTVDDSCDGAGVCSGTSGDCSDGIDCTEDACNEAEDLCENFVNDSNCGLGEICDSAGGCVEDSCAGIMQCLNYTDLANCTDDSCGLGNCLWLGSCREACEGIDTSCGAQPFCQDCDADDGCVFDQYRDFYCLGNEIGCNVSIDYCSDCSCDCGGYNQVESVANGNCNDGIDNDCDNLTDKDFECMPVDYVSYWKFESETGGVVFDEQGRNNGTLLGGASIVEDVGRGSVLNLVGEGNYVDTSFVIPDEGTVLFWFNPNFGGEIRDEMVFMDARDSVRWWTVGTGGYFGDHQLTFSLEDTRDANYFSSFEMDGYISEGNWYHVAGTWKVGDPLRLYVDGVLRGEGSSKLASFDVDDTMRIGYPLTPSYTYPVVGYFDGLMDDVMVFNRSLSEEEILQVYNVQDYSSVAELSPWARIVGWVRGLLGF